MVVEELGELLAAINQYERDRISLVELAEEAADARIIIQQLETLLVECEGLPQGEGFRILEKKRDELEAALDEWEAQNGGGPS